MFQSEILDQKDVASLFAYWQKKPLIAHQYVQLIKNYIAGLEDISPAFSKMFVLGHSKSDTKRLEKSLDNAQQLILDSLPKKWAYLSAEGEKVPATPDAYSKNGFVNTFVTTLDYEASGVAIETAMGSIDADSISSLIVRLRGCELTNWEFLRDLFVYTSTFWSPAYAYSEGTGTEQDINNLNEIPLGCFTYIANENLPTSVPPGIHTERIGSGVLIEIPNDAALNQQGTYTERLRDLRESLRLAGLLNDPFTI